MNISAIGAPSSPSLWLLLCFKIMREKRRNILTAAARAEPGEREEGTSQRSSGFFFCLCASVFKPGRRRRRSTTSLITVWGPCRHLLRVRDRLPRGDREIQVEKEVLEQISNGGRYEAQVKRTSQNLNNKFPPLYRLSVIDSWKNKKFS